MMAPTPIPTIEDIVWRLWERCLRASIRVASFAQAFGFDVPLAESTQRLVAETRALLIEQGHSREECDYILFGVYNRIHWDFPQPAARVFEQILAFELDDFFKRRNANA